MSHVKYIYTVAEHFDQGINPGQLYNEISANTEISPNLINVFHQVNNDVDVTFESTLSSGELTTTNTIIDIHAPFQAAELISTANYIQINSSLSDNQAIIIDASNENGGIDIDSGDGGITIDTRNSLNITSNAKSCWRTLNVGNLDFVAKGILNIEGEGGIIIGGNNDAQAINIGASTSARPITIGNQTTSTGVTVNTGTSGFTVDSANNGVISIDAINSNSNITMTSIEDDKELRIEMLGATQSSLHLRSEGTQVDAIKFSTLNSAGGMDIDVGTTGFDLDTTGPVNLASSQAAGGSITLDAASGGLTFSAGTFGVALNASGSGIVGIGHWGGGDIQLGTAATSRAITIGNQTSATGVTVNTGTSGFTVDSANNGVISIDAINSNSNITMTSIEDDKELRIEMLGATQSSLHLRSEGTQVDAIKFSTLNSAGGMDIDLGTTGFDLDTTGPVNLASSQAAGGSITLDAASGGLTFSAGVYGVALNASGTGSVGIGHWSGGDIQLGTAATSRTITIGNRTSSTSLIQRHSDSGFRSVTQGDPTGYSDGNQTATITELKTRILTMTPTTDRTVTLPTADLAVAGLSGIAANDAIEFFVINESSHSSDPSVIVAVGTDGTLVGNGEVAVKENNANTWKTSGSGGFLMRFTSVGDSGNAYTVYRLP